MGHLRLGRLPKTPRWNEVVALLESSPTATVEITQATLHASERQLRKLGDDPSVSYCFWLLTRVTQAARQDDFVEALSELGLEVSSDTTALRFISQISDHVRKRLAEHPESGPFAELASLALRRALSETVGQQGPSLFASSLEDLQRALRTYSTREQFAAVGQLFFADFLARTLTYFLDRELANSLGTPAGTSLAEASRDVLEAVDRYTRQSALIVRDFAGGWYSKHNWESKGRISQHETDRFVAYALRKLRSELQHEAH